LTEEIVGAYSLGKELLGDRQHHIAPLIEEVIGGLGLLEDERAKEKEITKHRD